MSSKNEFMKRAIDLAKKGEGRTNPNPLVGAVIVKDGKIIGEGYHHIYGDLHAERDALKNCYQNNNDPAGAEIYVTLEPCCHFGKQPPCVHAIQEAGISKVIVGSRDPNPLVHGKGNAYLREHGIDVEEDFMKEECDELNPVFFHYISKNLPYVALKYAMTLDGKIATKRGESKWITGEKSREYVHHLRNRYSGIMAGIGTVLADDPMLDCRLKNERGEKIGRNPVRIICDSKLRIPLDSKIVCSAGEIKTILACSKIQENSSEGEEIKKRKGLLEEKGIEIIETPSSDDSKYIDLAPLMKILAEKKIDSILVEGGSEIHYSALNSGIVNKIYAFIAPKIFGGNGKSPVGGEGIDKLKDSFNFKLKSISSFDEDLLLEYNE